MAEATDRQLGDTSRPERFSGTSGRVAAGIAAVLASAALIAVLLDGVDRGDLVVLAVVLLVAAIVWVVYLRPSVVVSDRDLILRGMVSETHIPLEQVREFEVRQFVVVRTVDQSYTCTALGRGRRELIRGGDKLRDPVNHFPAFVEQRVLHRAEEARASSDSEDAAAAGQDPERTSRRVVAWPEIAALVTLVAITAILIAVI